MLPDWPAGTVTVLATGGSPPHAIPVSAAVRAGPRTILIALGDSRESLSRLRADPAVALAIIAGPDIALTAYGTAHEIEGQVPAGIVPVRIDVERVQDHGRPAFEIESGVRWHWTDAEAAARDEDVRMALAEIAARSGQDG